MKARITPFANLSAVEASKMFRFVRSFSLLFLAGSLVLLTSSAEAQDVTTWHNNIGRTGWQSSETSLTPSNAVFNSFGKVFQYTLLGTTEDVYAQPLAVSNVAVTGCHPLYPCDVVYIATEQDVLYAFDATSSTKFWSTDLAAAAGGTFLDCTPTPPPLPCAADHSILRHHIGVTGTPVIDSSAGILYVVTLVDEGLPSPVEYYIHAVNIKTGSEEPHSPQLITATAAGLAPSAQCGISVGGSTVGFDASEHLQRAGLLLLGGTVYVAFAAADGEMANGWILGYTYSTQSGFSLAATFNDTPTGTGGGIWQSGAGLAAVINEGGKNYLFVSTGNGSFDHNTGGVNYGDSMLRLNPDLSVSDYFTPGDVFSFNGSGLCLNDEDYGSGGVLIFPDSFVPNHSNVLVHADKESKLYILDRDNLGQYVGPPGTDRAVEEKQTPMPVESGQEYLSSPAYWEWTSGGTTTRAIYYSALVTRGIGIAPLALNMYQLAASASPFSVMPTAFTGTQFCGNGTRPSISSNGTTPGTGIVWAIEATNRTNIPPHPDCSGAFGFAELHAYNATNSSTNLLELYNSAGASGIGYPTSFSAPTIYKGRVYMGTENEVDVFGLCSMCK
jgi:hypothetical protein